MPPPIADFRSDTVTRPTAAMREAMARAEVGDDVYGDDPTVNALQDRLAADLGFDAGLFVASGTQSNLIALMAHCQRGDEYLVGADAHTYKYEGGGAAVLGSIQPQPIPQADDGSLPLEAVRKAIKPDDPHFARSRVLCLENTWHGKPLPLAYAPDARALCDERGLALHLDGARLFNAAVAQGVPVRTLVAPFHSVSVCLSKGLGAPVGSVLLGSAELIARGKRLKKLLGGGWRQAGMLAAAALHALDHHVERLADDHRRARDLAAGLAVIPRLAVETPQTNLVFVTVPEAALPRLRATLHENGLIASVGGPRLRLATHLDIDDAAIGRCVAAFREALG
jgi:threonine aldolase